MKLIFYTFFFSAILIVSCKQNAVHKPKGYFKIDFPKKQYQLFEKADYPYSFEYPTYAIVIKDTTFFGDKTENPWWINIDFPTLHGKIYLSYKEIGKYKLDTLLKHSFKLSDAHSLKASYKEDSLFKTPNNVYGLFFNIGGNVATSNQFLITDSSKHFMRGALYFDATPNEDSLGIVNEFVLEDMKHLINTLKWK